MIITNLATNPGFKATGSQPSYGGSTNGIGVAKDGVLTVTTMRTLNNLYDSVRITVPVMPGQSYHVRVNVTNWTTPTPMPSDSPRVIMVRNGPSGVNLLTSPMLGVYPQHGVADADFLVPPNISVAYLCLQGPNVEGGTVEYRNLIVCTQSDWQAIQSLGLDYFDGTTMPLDQ